MNFNPGFKLFGNHALAGLMIVAGAWLLVEGDSAGGILTTIGIIYGIGLGIFDMYMREKILDLEKYR